MFGFFGCSQRDIMIIYAVIGLVFVAIFSFIMDSISPTIYIYKEKNIKLDYRSGQDYGGVVLDDE